VQWRAFLRDGAQQGVFAIQLPDRSSRLIEFNAQANFVTGLHCSFVTAAQDRSDPPDKQEPLTNLRVDEASALWGGLAASRTISKPCSWDYRKPWDSP
jgi:hypothetical protein